MKERGILFSAPMVRALLAGKKTQTRRIVKLPADSGTVHVDPGGTIFGPGPYLKVEAINGANAGATMHPRIRCPYGYPGDRLWVRETWSHDAPDLATRRAAHEDALGAGTYGPYYRATEVAPDTLRWTPAIHMPRWASRITLEVTEVRVQRLQDITEADARAEGVEPFPLDPEGDCWTDGKYRTAFNYLWNEINGWNPDSWASNPWVWCVSFKRVESP